MERLRIQQNRHTGSVNHRLGCANSNVVGLSDNDSKSLRRDETTPKKATFAGKQWKPIKGI